MQYFLNNRLSDFEFHDTEFFLNSYENDTLCVTAKHLNLHKGTKENPNDCDMEIKNAEISFQNVQIFSFAPLQAYKISKDGNRYADERPIVHTGAEAKQKVITALKNGISLNCIAIRKDKDLYFLELTANDGFVAEICFQNVIVAWDEYIGKAWYELYKKYDCEIYLDTPAGETSVPVHIIYTEDTEDEPNIVKNIPIASVGIEFDKEAFWGYGKNYFWQDAFADLQKKLPENVKLKCCLTCKHGNMCPVGNFQNELFCTKDVLITQKSDLFFYTEDEQERKKRHRKYTDICSDFAYQSEDYFTYNDWLYILNEE